MGQNLDLVLSDLEGDSKKIADTVHNWYVREAEDKFERAVAWSQALHFLMGNQWISYNNNERRWNTIPITQDNQHIDRPTTNHINRWTRINVSGFTNKPNTSIEANSDEPDDKTAAKTAEIIMSYLWEAQKKGDQYYECALWGLITGLTARKSFKRNSMYAAGDQPLKVQDSRPVSPFNITFDGIPSRFRDIGIVMETDVVRLEDLKREYGEAKCKDLKAEKVQSSSLSIKEGLKNIVDGVPNLRSGKTDGEDLKDCVIKKEVYCQPCKKYPKGRMIVCAGSVTLYDGESPYYYQEGRYWHPYTFWNFEKVPGNLWGMGLVSRLVPLQKKVNSIDALIAYNRKTMAVPRLMNPRDSGIKDGEVTGMPGQKIDYEPSLTGIKPEFVYGIPLPPQVMEERSVAITDGDLLAMSGDLRSGQNPTGVNTVGQLQILMEQSEMSRARQIEDWEEFVQESEKLDLLNFQSCYQAPIPEVYKNIKRYSKDITKTNWETFVGSDLRDNSTVRVEKGSTLSKSRFVRQGLVLNLADKGYLGDFMTDPYRYREFLGEFGLGNMFSDQQVDVVMAEECLGMLLKGKYPPLLEQYNPDIHMMVLARYMKNPKYLELADPIKKLFMQRFDELAKQLAMYPTLPDEPEIAGAGGGGKGENKSDIENTLKIA